MNNKAITLYLMRHGELENTQLLAGRTDLLLSDKGQQQMLENINALDIQHCISSPLSRCHLVSESCCLQKGIPFEVEDQIQEYNFGEWDGLSFQQLWQQEKPNIGDFWQNPRHVTPPSGESFLTFESRVLSWWQEYLNALSSNNDKTLIVTHAGVIKVIIANVLQVKNSSDLINKLKINYASPIQLSIVIEGEKRWASLSL